MSINNERENRPWSFATKHFHQTKHPLTRSAEPSEEWVWYYVDERCAVTGSSAFLREENLRPLPMVAAVCYPFVAIMWLIPNRRIERKLTQA